MMARDGRIIGVLTHFVGVESGYAAAGEGRGRNGRVTWAFDARRKGTDEGDEEERQENEKGRQAAGADEWIHVEYLVL